MTRITRILLAGCLAVNFALFAWIGIAILKYPYGVNFGEAILLDLAKRLITGQAIYSANIQNPPFFFSNYPPVYPALMAFASIITGMPLLFLGRLISLLSAVASLTIIWKITLKTTGRGLAGLLAGMLFIGHPYVIIWSSLARMDLLALAFSLLSFWIVIKHWESTGALLFAAVCLLIAIFTRQTYLFAVPLASLVWLWHKDRRRLVYYAITLYAGGIFLVVLLNLNTHGGFFFDVVLANVGVYTLTRTLIALNQFAFTWPVIILFSGISMASVIIAKQPLKEGSGQDGLDQTFLKYGLMPYTAGALAAALMIGKEGSDINYLLELMAALSVWGAYGAILLHSRLKVRHSLVSALLIFQLIWIFIVQGLPMLSSVNAILAQKPRQDALFQEVKAAAKQGQVLADDQLDLVVLAGQDIYYEPFLFGQLYATKQWNPTTFIDEIYNQKFSLILISGDDIYKERYWPTPLADAIKSSYVIESLPGLQIGKPRGK